MIKNNGAGTYHGLTSPQLDTTSFFAVKRWRDTIRFMKKLTMIMTTLFLLTACHARTVADQSSPAALKAAELRHFRKDAEQDRIDAQRQLNLVRARTQSQTRDQPKT
jgi:preprotein translocase subunit SecG